MLVDRLLFLVCCCVLLVGCRLLFVVVLWMLCVCWFCLLLVRRVLLKLIVGLSLSVFCPLRVEPCVMFVASCLSVVCLFVCVFACLFVV